MDMQERALAYLDDDELVQLTRDLVRMRSINPPG
jgi:predicted membrane GTPase involved in stress response